MSTDTDPMPVFTIKGKDALALSTIDIYREGCVASGLHEQARQVALAWKEIADWQERHPDLVQLPDHPHVPATQTGA